MKIGIGHAYWGNTWSCDIEKYKRIAKKLADFGFTMFEVTADHIYHMSEKELIEFDAVAKEYGLTLSTNSGPAKQYDLSSPNREIRENGLEYFTQIVKTYSSQSV